MKQKMNHAIASKNRHGEIADTVIDIAIFGHGLSKLSLGFVLGRYISNCRAAGKFA